MSELALKLIAENKAKYAQGEDVRKLDLVNCGLIEVPKSLNDCIWLETLNLSQNIKLNDISNVVDLLNLKQFECSSTKVDDLTPLANLTNLQHLSCSSTNVNDLTPLANLTNLQHINCATLNVSDLTPLANLTNLQQLSCSSTNVSDLTPLANLTNLQQLSCSSTNISDLTPLANLVNLQRLNCSTTNVSDLTPLAKLFNLFFINISNTQVIDLWPLASIINLKQFNCSNTRVIDLQPLSNLLNLHDVNCSYTMVVDLSPFLSIIKFGKKVKLLTNTPNKGGIFVENCPITTPPLEIVKQGDYAILRYFEELERAKQTGSVIRLAEAKCLILGAGGAGKTSLTQKLLHHNNPLPEETQTTKGINVYPHDLKLPDGTDFRLNIWDFGGQEIYHATHQFFLTKRSLYILLDDTRSGEKTVNDPIFNYWLQIAELYGGSSPLLIVQNEKGDRSKELDLRGMQGRFSFVKDAKATNLLTCRGLDKVWEAIEFWLKQLPHVGEVQPKVWLDIRRKLERLAREDKRDYISLEEYYQICTQHTIPERERALFLSSYLHDFGAFLHFQDHPLLRKTLILNNQWATDAVYKVLDCEDIKRTFGRFNRQDLTKIWVDNCYTDQHEELLALMEKFELCYKLPDEKTETWLAPQLLSVMQPIVLSWDETNNLQVRYEFEFMPKGLLSQHIVRMHRYILQLELAWKSGVIFERADSQALVTEAWGSRKISLKARGVQAKELLTLLCEDFDKMHERLEGLKVKKMIPCNCQMCRKAVEPHFYDYEKLARRRADGKRTVECDLSYEDVSVVGLLDGVFAKVLNEERETKKQKLKTIKIFLASSEELREDRDQFEIFLSRENDHLFEKGIRLQLVRWENFLDAISTTRLQDEYNKILCTCNIVVCLFYTKVGKYTAEEFDTALGQFRGVGTPIIYTYFKDTPVRLSELNEFYTVNEFKEKLRSLGHFPNKYESLGDLKHHFGEQLKKLGISG